MDVSRPYAAVAPGLEGDVLNVLARTSRGLTGREVALLTGRTSHSGVLAVLHRLSDEGLVERVELNRSYLFALNRAHIAAPAVAILAGLRDELLDRVRGLLKAWAMPPVHASLFGSAARGDGDADSDIDLLVVRPASVAPEDPGWLDQLARLEQGVHRWTGNRAAIQQVPENDLPRLAAEDRPIVSELLHDAIALSGPELSTLLTGE
jgi:predicted nucleotidyltransferase